MVVRDGPPEVPVGYCSYPPNARFGAESAFAVRQRGTIGPWPMRTRDAMLAAMLFFVRLLGFLAPFAIAGLAVIAVAVTAQTEPADREALALVVAAGVVAGMTTMALVAWSYIG